jgi:ATPase subunit of ABC transporter with duplicated ATPase domains
MNVADAGQRIHARLKHFVHTQRHSAARNDALAPAYRAAQNRLARFKKAGPPTRPPKEQNVRIRLRGGRTGKQAVLCDQLELTGLMKPFDLELWYGERIAVLGSNGSGKSQFLTLLAYTGGNGKCPVPHRGTIRLGARVVPGHFAQTHTRPDLHGRTPADILMTEHALIRNDAMAAHTAPFYPSSMRRAPSCAASNSRATSSGSRRLACSRLMPAVSASVASSSSTGT